MGSFHIENSCHPDVNRGSLPKGISITENYSRISRLMYFSHPIRDPPRNEIFNRPVFIYLKLFSMQKLLVAIIALAIFSCNSKDKKEGETKDKTADVLNTSGYT